MWSISLICLYSALYDKMNTKTSSSRKYRENIYTIQKEFWLIFLVFMMKISNFVCDAEVTLYSESQGDWYTAALNMTEIKEIEFEAFIENNSIALNITWERDGIKPAYYTLHMIPLYNDDHCKDAILITSKLNGDNTNNILTGKIYPGCPYSVEMTPFNSSVKKINYTVPDCVETICSCSLKHDLTEPKLEWFYKSSYYYIKLNISANLTWLSSHNLTKIQYKFLSERQKDVIKEQNISNEDANKVIERSFSESEIDLSPESINALYVRVWDQRNCAVGYIQESIKRDSYEEEDMTYGWTYGHSSENIRPSHWMFTIIFPLMCIVTFMGLIVYLMRNTKCYSCLRKLCLVNFQCSTQPEICRIYGSPNSDRLSGPTYFSIPMEVNNLYVDKEIMDGIENGKADKFEISYQQLSIEKEIGEGAFGQVYKATTTSVNGIQGYNTVAVKMLNKIASPEESKNLLSEIAMLKRIGYHPNIVRLLGYCTRKKPYCMIMEYIPCGDLSKYLLALRDAYEKKEKSFLFTINEGLDLISHSTFENISASSYITPESFPTLRLPSPERETEYTMLNSAGIPILPSSSTSSPNVVLECELDPKELQSFALQIAKGMEYLESKEIVHRDLAARNVLIDENKTLKISDFGLSRSGIYVNTKQTQLPLRWLSIEAIRDNLYTNKSDVWAFGIVLWEIGTLGAFPYPSLGNHEILPFLLKGKRLDKPENCTDELYTLMKQCWSHSKDQRPFFKQLVQDLKSVSNNKHVYVDFSQLNPSYVFPPTEELFLTQIRTDDNIQTVIEINLS